MLTGNPTMGRISPRSRVRSLIPVAILLVGLLIVLGVLRTSQEEDLSTILTFAVVGDSRGSTTVFPAIIDSINRIHPEFVVHLGDLIHGYTSDLSKIKKQWERVDRQLSSLQAPLFLAPGNHDTYTEKSVADSRLVAFLRQRFEGCPFSIERSGALFLFVNSSLPGDEGRLGADQMRWLRDQLQLWPPGRGPAFLFLHHPLVSPSGRTLKNARAVLHLLKGTAVKHVFCSHDHLFREIPLPHDIVEFISGGGGAPLRGLPAREGGFYHFLIVKLMDNGSVSTQIHRLEELVESEQTWPPRDYESG